MFCTYRIGSIFKRSSIVKCTCKKSGRERGIPRKSERRCKKVENDIGSDFGTEQAAVFRVCLLSSASQVELSKVSTQLAITPHCALEGKVRATIRQDL